MPPSMKANSLQDILENHVELLEGILLRGQSRCSLRPKEFIFQAALSEEFKRIERQARSGQSAARGYVGGRRKAFAESSIL